MQVLHRVKTWQKLALLVFVGVALSSLPTVMLLQKIGADIAFSERELQGSDTTKKLLATLQSVQKHRGLSAGFLGNNTLAEQRETMKRTIFDNYAASRASLMQAKDKDKALKQFDAAERSWKELAAAVDAKSIPVRESYLRHTQLAADLLGVVDAVLDHSWLIFDPEADGYFVIVSTYVHIPWLAEGLGQARALGTGLVAQKQASMEDRFTMTALLDRAKERMESAQSMIGKVLQTNPELKAKLEAPLADAAARATKAIGITRLEIVEAKEITFPSTEYYTTYTEAIDAQFKLIDILAASLDATLQGRLAKQGRDRMLAVFGAIALLAFAITLSYWISRSITDRLNRAVGVANAISAGRLDNRIEADLDSRDETGELLRALKTMQQGLVEVVLQIQAASAAIHEASTQVAHGNTDLSARTEEQASSLEETAASIEELSATVKQNAEHARNATQVVSTASTMASEGGSVVSQAVNAMRSISDSSRRIVDIISVIDGIAFQTNILALNAAVEAARAGEQGRGFAVVAGEVRNLSKRCADAAKEIKELIQTSVGEVESGSVHVESTGKTMSNIVSSVQQISTIFGEISTASAEQSSGINQVSQTITQMDNVTQQNAALVEQAAAASLSLQDQAEQLEKVVSRFKLNGAHVDTSRIASAASASPHDAAALRAMASAKRLGRSPSRRIPPPSATLPKAEQHEWAEF
jgi:methyl-accepting chemotaxis protein